METSWTEIFWANFFEGKKSAEVDPVATHEGEDFFEDAGKGNPTRHPPLKEIQHKLDRGI